ncbi:MAG TPA: phosphatidylglycerophosphatase A, partial [Stellaceae bacterium]|nr:phosphatidylglycerophosphatase A [Stellaceae bacterium]
LLTRPAGLPFHHPAMLLSTWFGAGLLPKIPGTWGSLAALPFAWYIGSEFGGLGLVISAAIVFVVGCWAADTASRAGDVRDPGFIVIDEVAAQFLVLAVAPVGAVAYAAGFVLFRIADIVKPFPANWADREVHGGLGIMLDDIFAALYAGLALFLLVRFGLV